MEGKFQAVMKTAEPSSPCASSALLQRKCACGNHTIAGGECEECRKKPPQSSAPGQPTDTRAHSSMEMRPGQDFSRVRMHRDSKAASLTQRASNGNAFLPAVVDHDKDEPKGAPKQAPPPAPKQAPPPSAPKAPPADAPTAAPKEPTGSCGGKSLANSIVESDKRMNGSKVEASLGQSEFGDTTKLGADFRFSACKVSGAWRFQLDALVVPVVSKVQDIAFRKNINAATDAEVTQTTYKQIVRDLSPKRTVTATVSCGGQSFSDTITTYSPRRTYWNQQLVIEHEAFHRRNWIEMYKKELTKAESDIWAHSIPESEASNAAAAVAKADTVLTKHMTDAYQRLCAAYAPKKESRAYDAGAPAYQQLVDQINDRAKKESW